MGIHAVPPHERSAPRAAQTGRLTDPADPAGHRRRGRRAGHGTVPGTAQRAARRPGHAARPGHRAERGGGPVAGLRPPCHGGDGRQPRTGHRRTAAPGHRGRVRGRPRPERDPPLAPQPRTHRTARLDRPEGSAGRPRGHGDRRRHPGPLRPRQGTADRRRRRDRRCRLGRHLLRRRPRPAARRHPRPARVRRRRPRGRCPRRLPAVPQDPAADPGPGLLRHRRTARGARGDAALHPRRRDRPRPARPGPPGERRGRPSARSPPQHFPAPPGTADPTDGAGTADPADSLTGRPLDEVLGAGRTADVLSGRVTGRDLLTVQGPRVLVANRMPTEDGGAVATLRDRTELEHLSRELDSTRGLIDALRAQDHEHANRLHTLLGLLELGLHEEAVEFVTEVVGVHRTTAEQVTEKIHDPLLAALLVGKATVAAERGVPLRLAAASLLPDRLVDPGGLVTIVGNLVDNALDAAVGSASPAVEVELRAEGRAAVLRVRDSGPGVPAAHREEIFTEGWSTKQPAAHRERGLGLALVRRLAERQGGTARAGGAEDGGAEFSVVLPEALR
ncbi:sensor histidine kinase [Streptomyces nojiriensis]